MKKFHYFSYVLFEFFLISIFFIIPPILPSLQIHSDNNFEVDNYVSIFFILTSSLLLALLLCFFPEKKSIKEYYFSYFKFYHFFYSFNTLKIMFIITLIIKYAFSFFKIELIHVPTINLNFTFRSLFPFVINIFVKATYEEILYRFYIVNRLKYMISYVQNIKLSKFLNIFAEIIAICLFALAHKYLGIFAILNAFFAAIYLRILIWKTNDNLLWNIVVHSLYNIIVIFLTQ